jgi:transcriptional regulator with XRE-family HTH domain
MESARELLGKRIRHLRNLRGLTQQKLRGKSLQRHYDVIHIRLTKQYEAIESGIISLDMVAERIRDLKAQLFIIRE